MTEYSGKFSYFFTLEIKIRIKLGEIFIKNKTNQYTKTNAEMKEPVFKEI